MAGLLMAGTDAVGSTNASAVTRITVTAGKPSEFKFTLSKKKIAAAGTVIFTVVNKGETAHNFVIAGKKTPMIKPGGSAKLRVVFKKKGSYAFKCSVDGHARLGMKGSFGVGVRPAPTPTTTTVTTTTAACASPQSTTVNVSELDYRYVLSRDTVACGTVTFVQKNDGGATHNFDLVGVQGGNGALIQPGQTTTMTVQLRPGTVSYQCDVQDHAALGMVGKLTVTG
jgi:uncharacterized cupredoxin-like copper-binding protein